MADQDTVIVPIASAGAAQIQSIGWDIAQGGISFSNIAPAFVPSCFLVSKSLDLFTFKYGVNVTATAAPIGTIVFFQTQITNAAILAYFADITSPWSVSTSAVVRITKPASEVTETAQVTLTWDGTTLIFLVTYDSNNSSVDPGDILDIIESGPNSGVVLNFQRTTNGM